MGACLPLGLAGDLQLKKEVRNSDRKIQNFGITLKLQPILCLCHTTATACLTWSAQLQHSSESPWPAQGGP